MPRTLTVGIVLAVVSLVIWLSRWPTLVEGNLVFKTQKMCQLTGEIDKQFNKNTLNRYKHYGITGSDLGYPVPWNDKLIFLFGDTRSHDPEIFLPPGSDEFDSIAYAPLHTDVDRKGCVALDFVKESEDAFWPVQLAEKDKLHRKLGVFEVPISGFSSNNKLYGFFALREKPSPPGCKNNEGCSPVDSEPGGQTKLGVSDDGGKTFREVALVSKAKFQWPVPLLDKAEFIPGFPSNFTGKVVLVWGTGKVNSSFRHGYPYFAVAPFSSIDKMETWRYYAGLGQDGKPIWREHESDAVPVPPFGPSHLIVDPNFGHDFHKCLGEFSVGYVNHWNRWVMLYACGSSPKGDPEKRYKEFKNYNRGIYLRTADMPWGPWSKPQRIFDPAEGYCRFMHYKYPCPAGSPNPRDNGVQELNNGQPTGIQANGGEYAPYLIPSYTKVDGDTTSLYWVMSTWNPYQSVLMRTQIRPPRMAEVIIPRSLRDLIGIKD